MDLKPTLLIIDDEPAICELLSFEFSNHSFEVALAHSYHDAMLELSKRKPDVVICDLNLSGQSGSTLLKEVKQNHQDIPFILITGSTEFTILDAYRWGADDFFVKPFKRSEIFKSVCSKLEKNWTRELLPLTSQKFARYNLDLENADIKLSGPKLLIGRIGAYIFSSDELPSVDDVIQLNLKCDVRVLVTIIGKVRFTNPLTEPGYGLEIYSVVGEKSAVLIDHLSQTKTGLAIPIPRSLA
jgi:CheY-like chemotaxis protein